MSIMQVDTDVYRGNPMICYFCVIAVLGQQSYDIFDWLLDELRCHSTIIDIPIHIFFNIFSLFQLDGIAFLMKIRR